MIVSDIIFHKTQFKLSLSFIQMYEKTVARLIHKSIY